LSITLRDWEWSFGLCRAVPRRIVIVKRNVLVGFQPFGAALAREHINQDAAEGPKNSTSARGLEFSMW
jgi:hypothetical protein